MSFSEIDFEKLDEAEAARIKEDIESYRKLVSQADAIAGPGGIHRLIIIPLLYGISAALVFFGVILWTTRASVIAGMFIVLSGIPMFLIALILFLKLKKTQPIYKKATKIRESIEKLTEENKYQIDAYEEIN